MEESLDGEVGDGESQGGPKRWEAHAVHHENGQ